MMSALKRLFVFSSKRLLQRSDPVKEIAVKMRPVDEAGMRLPRSFAHTMRYILSAGPSTHDHRNE